MDAILALRLLAELHRNFNRQLDMAYIDIVRVHWGLACGANLWFGGFPYPVNPGRPEWSKVQTRGKPPVATAQAKYRSAGER